MTLERSSTSPTKSSTLIALLRKTLGLVWISVAVVVFPNFIADCLNIASNFYRTSCVDNSYTRCLQANPEFKGAEACTEIKPAAPTLKLSPACHRLSHISNALPKFGSGLAFYIPFWLNVLFFTSGLLITLLRATSLVTPLRPQWNELRESGFTYFLWLLPAIMLSPAAVFSGSTGVLLLICYVAAGSYFRLRYHPQVSRAGIMKTAGVLCLGVSIATIYYFASPISGKCNTPSHLIFLDDLRSSLYWMTKYLTLVSFPIAGNCALLCILGLRQFRWIGWCSLSIALGLFIGGHFLTCFN